MGGVPTHPSWLRNMNVSSRVEQQDGVTRKIYSARHLSGLERDTWGCLTWRRT